MTKRELRQLRKAKEKLLSLGSFLMGILASFNDKIRDKI